MIEGKRILIFGGSGSLGNTLVNRYIDRNAIFVYSRDENKHWHMSHKYQTKESLNFIIGDIRDSEKVRMTLIRVKPHIVIIAAALKHIDRCEYESHESINTNILGTKNILDSIESLKLPDLETTCFISTDKACSPVNVYGMCKALSEALVVEKANVITDKKFVVVRYGNVLNSRGSIIPVLHKIGNDPARKNFNLTDRRMTRFIMTLQESVNLIEYAICEGESGDIIIPDLKAMKIADLLRIFSDKYGKDVMVTGIRPGEKIHESLINETQSSRTVKRKEYYHVKPYFNCEITNKVYDFHSGLTQVSIDELQQYLNKLSLLG